MRYYSSLVIRNSDGEFLTIHHSKKSQHPWRFAGGKLEDGELPIVGAARELKEELGIVATSLALVGTPTLNVDGNDWTGYFFLVGSYEGTPTIQEPDKHSEISYLTTNDLLRLDSHPEFEVALGVKLSGQQ